jgi:hypothetical protein
MEEPGAATLSIARPIILAKENKFGSILFHGFDSAFAQHVHRRTSNNLQLHGGAIVKQNRNQPFFFVYDLDGSPSNDIGQGFIHLHQPTIYCSDLFESPICEARPAESARKSELAVSLHPGPHVTNLILQVCSTSALFEKGRSLRATTSSDWTRFISTKICLALAIWRAKIETPPVSS